MAADCTSVRPLMVSEGSKRHQIHGVVRAGGSALLRDDALPRLVERIAGVPLSMAARKALSQELWRRLVRWCRDIGPVA